MSGRSGHRPLIPAYALGRMADGQRGFSLSEDGIREGWKKMTSLRGRVAIVTGASRGIGLGIATELVRRGAKVCVTARKAEPLTAALAEIGGPDVAIAVPGKADDTGHQAEVIATTIEAFGRLRHAGQQRRQDQPRLRPHQPMLIPLPPPRSWP